MGLIFFIIKLYIAGLILNLAFEDAGDIPQQNIPGPIGVLVL